MSGQSTLAAAVASLSFSTKTNLSSNTITESGQQRKVAAAGNNIYTIWTDDTPGNDEIFFRRSTDGGSTFGSTINLSNNGGESFNPHMAVS
ncbi:MAG: hypothetical protein WBZ20_01095 [Nitrososphaeraceae archaeon]